MTDWQDDTVVGRVQTDSVHGNYGGELTETEIYEEVYLRDLDPAVQQALRERDEAVTVAERHMELKNTMLDAYDRMDRLSDEEKASLPIWVRQGLYMGMALALVINRIAGIGECEQHD